MGGLDDVTMCKYGDVKISKFANELSLQNSFYPLFLLSKLCVIFARNENS